MWEWTDIITSSLLFVSLFFEVFLLLTFWENRRHLNRFRGAEPAYYPTATVIVPCFNEETSIFGTIDSLLKLDYPKDKLDIMIIDDGSTDNSWELIQKYKGHPQIKLFHKENGGKHTALNFAIAQSKSEIIGCLDADSFVEGNALKKIALHFADPKIMSVVPSIKVFKAKNPLEKVQKVQYEWGIFVRKTLSYLNSLYVTPGPFSFFRREVFEKIGPYRKAHNTEDCEMALRMQKNHLRIANCHDAYIYTVTPKGLKALYKQQLRWVYGTLKNLLDYRDLFLKREYHNLGLVVLPVIFLSSLAALFGAGLFIVRTSINIGAQIQKWESISFNWVWPNISFEAFFIKTDFHLFLGIIAFLIVLAIIFTGKKMANEKIRTSGDILYFFIIYPFIAPFWLFRAIFNIITSQKTSWR